MCPDVIKEELERVGGDGTLVLMFCCIGVLFGCCNKDEIWTKVHLRCTMSIDLPSICSCVLFVLLNQLLK
jgi:hypothetical protein